MISGVIWIIWDRKAKWNSNIAFVFVFCPSGLNSWNYFFPMFVQSEEGHFGGLIQWRMDTSTRKHKCW